LVVGLIPDQHNDSFKKALLGILKEVGGVDLPAFKRPSSSKTLWEEIADIRLLRNKIAHAGVHVPPEEAERAIDIASTVLEVLFPKVIAELGLKTDAKLNIFTK